MAYDSYRMAYFSSKGWPVLPFQGWPSTITTSATVATAPVASLVDDLLAKFREFQPYVLSLDLNVNVGGSSASSPPLVGQLPPTTVAATVLVEDNQAGTGTMSAARSGRWQSKGSNSCRDAATTGSCRRS